MRIAQFLAILIILITTQACSKKSDVEPKQPTETIEISQQGEVSPSDNNEISNNTQIDENTTKVRTNHQDASDIDINVSNIDTEETYYDSLTQDPPENEPSNAERWSDESDDDMDDNMDDEIEIPDIKGLSQFEIFDVLQDTFEGKFAGRHKYVDHLNRSDFNALIKAGAKINVRNEEGQTLLMVTNDNDVMKALIKAGINVNAKDKMGKTALMYAAKRVDRCLGFDSCDGVYNEDILIASGADVNAKDKNGMTAMMHINTLMEETDSDFPSHSNLFIKKLIAAGAKVNDRSKNNKTPLMYAVYKDQVQTLVTAGADVNAKDKDGLTPIMYVEDMDAIDALIKAGANVKAKDKNGNTAFMYALVHQYRTYSPTQLKDRKRLIKMFSDAGADIHAKNNSKFTLSQIIQNTCSKIENENNKCEEKYAFYSGDDRYDKYEACQDKARSKLNNLERDIWLHLCSDNDEILEIRELLNEPEPEPEPEIYVPTKKSSKSKKSN